MEILVDFGGVSVPDLSYSSGYCYQIGTRKS
jgi:hypothetical protein